MKKKSFLTVKDRLYWKAYGEGQLDDEHGFEAGKRIGYRKGVEDAANFVEKWREKKVGTLLTYYEDDRIIARRIRALLEKSR